LNADSAISSPTFDELAQDRALADDLGVARMLAAEGVFCASAAM
jgi:hypothetical protein